MDPAIYAARQMCYTDSVAETWFAPAGFTRGRLTKPNDVEIVLNQGDRDSLYSGGNAINPIVEFPQQGITIFGQRTAQRNPSALDRVNVRRLLILLRKTLLASTQRFTFEPNDVITWQNIKTAAETILDDIRRRRGITDFKVVCDETTNTPARIDRSEVWCKIILIPTKAAEAIVFEINVTSNSAKLGS
jgi:phage tail sheath protein FI